MNGESVRRHVYLLTEKMTADDDVGCGLLELYCQAIMQFRGLNYKTDPNRNTNRKSVTLTLRARCTRDVVVVKWPVK